MTSHLNIVLVEDNGDLRDLLHRDLTKAGYKVALASCAEELANLSWNISFDVMILDVNLPGENGFDIALRFKRSNSKMYIIMLTARSSLSDKLMGYQRGADLYLCKPIASEELLAAIRGIERRLGNAAIKKAPTLNIRALTLAFVNEVGLTRTEANLIKALSEANHGSLPYFRLLKMSGYGVTSKSKAALEVRFVRLRKKLIDAGLDHNAIKAVRSEGYQLTVQIDVTA
jgi:DNA-binding response OmpR family regulator